MKLKNLIPKVITENLTQSYEYGCAMLYFVFDELENIHNIINKEDIYTEDDDSSFGLENEPHCTLLYGLHKEVTKKQIENITDKYTYFTVKAHNPSLFHAPNYDVLKLDIVGDNLKETNTDLKQLPYTSTHPKYNPHLTIGYLKKGSGKKYVEQLKKLKLTKFWLVPQYVLFLSENGKQKININID